MEEGYFVEVEYADGTKQVTRLETFNQYEAELACSAEFEKLNVKRARLFWVECETELGRTL